ncbi:MAG: LysR family transcriptional regulator [Candidatus Accumulibacter sp.]|nr:LysR family transcriptional regulator [Accumulibacter sp.]
MNEVSDLAFFVRLVQCGSLAATAQELGVTPPAVSRRLAALERRLGVRLLNRTTRSLGATPEGERYLEQARRILDDIGELERELAGSRSEPQGLLRVNTSFGFGRRLIAPLVSDFVRRHPKVEIQLQLTDRIPPLTDAAFDVSIRFGRPPDSRLYARRLLTNHRVLCAAPAYLDAHAPIETPKDLARHACIVIRENEAAYGSWQLFADDDKRRETVKVGGALSSNDGETAVKWALAGHGVLLRSLWDIAGELAADRLRRVLPGWQSAPADVYALYPERMHLSAKVRAFVDFLGERISA